MHNKAQSRKSKKNIPGVARITIVALLLASKTKAMWSQKRTGNI